jgi:hypothetical protein
MRSAGGSVGGSYFFDGGFVGVAVTQFNCAIASPALSRRRPIRASSFARRVTTGRVPSAVGSISKRPLLGGGRLHSTELANEGASDGVQQTFTNKDPRRGSKRSFARSTCPSRLDQRLRRAGHASDPDSPDARAGSSTQSTMKRRRLLVQRIQTDRYIENAACGTHRTCDRLRRISRTPRLRRSPEFY